LQIDLIDPAAEARRQGLGIALARENGGVPAAAVGLLLIKSPRQGEAGSK
jgi:hypothetical protein